MLLSFSKSRDHCDRWYIFVFPTWERLKVDAILHFYWQQKIIESFIRIQRLTLRTAIKQFIHCTTSKKDLFVVEDSFVTNYL